MFGWLSDRTPIFQDIPLKALSDSCRAYPNAEITTPDLKNKKEGRRISSLRTLV